MLLVLNAGSSSLKFALYGPAGPDWLAAPAWRGECEGVGADARMQVAAAAGPAEAIELPGGAGHAEALAQLLAWLERRALRPAAVAHRVVHGGRHYADPVRIDAQVLGALRELVPLAPLHQPHALAGIEALARLHPALPQVACFDTAFHHGLPELEATYALPAALRARGVRRYGFHGLSCEHALSRLERLAGPQVAAGRVVIAHLGAGASLCAVRAGRSQAVTMGFTALDGLTMARRCGALDPGVPLYLQQQLGMGVDELARVLYEQSGLLGLSGESTDMRVLLASVRPEARFAIEHFCYRAARELGAMAAVLGGLDALVYTGGIGEHQAPVRALIASRARWLGLELDEAANAAGAGRLSTPGSAVSAWRIECDEHGVIARHAARLLGLG